MDRPSDVPEELWREANKAASEYLRESQNVTEHFARAMMSAEASMRLTLMRVREAINSPINSGAIVDTCWMPAPDGSNISITTLHDFIDLALGIPAPPPLSASPDGTNGPGYADTDPDLLRADDDGMGLVRRG